MSNSTFLSSNSNCTLQDYSLICAQKYAEYVGFSSFDEYFEDRYQETGSKSAGHNEFMKNIGFDTPAAKGLIDDFRIQVWISRVTGLISLISSIWILYDLRISHKNGGNSRNSRNRNNEWNTGSFILALISICDIFVSLFFFIIGPIMAPKVEWIPGSFGNDATCNIQGFITSTGAVASIQYNATIALYFLLSVKYEWKETRFRLPINQFCFLTFPLFVSFLLAVWTLFSKNRNIYFPGFPNVVGCIRGGFFQLFEIASILICTITIVGSMISLWLYIRNTGQRTQRYASGPNSNSRSTARTEAAARVGILFSSCYVITYFPYFILVTVLLIYGGNPFFWLKMMSAIFIPLQGFLNMLTYQYRKDQKIFKKRMDYIKNVFQSCKRPKSNNTDGADINIETEE